VAHPRLLILIGVIFLLMPFVNYFAVAQYGNTPLSDYDVVLSHLGKAPLAVRLFFLLTPFAIGLGLLKVKRWAWWLFLVYSVSLAAYDIYVLVGSPALYNIGATAQTVFATVTIIYLTRKDIYAPYFSATPRGFRAGKRYPLVIDATVAGASGKSRDISSTGIYVRLTGLACKVADRVDVSFVVDGTELKCQAEVIRAEPEGVALAYRSLDSAAQRTLERWLSRQA